MAHLQGESTVTPGVTAEIGGHRVSCQLLTGPDAIGICKILYRGDTLRRWHGHLVATNEVATQLLGTVRDQFVRRAPETWVTATGQGQADELESWTLDELDLLYAYLVSRYREDSERRGKLPASSPARKQLGQDLQGKAAEISVAKRWLKKRRAEMSILRAGVTDVHDPLQLLRRAEEVLYRVARSTGDREARDVAAAIACYRTKFAPVAKKQ